MIKHVLMFWNRLYKLWNIDSKSWAFVSQNNQLYLNLNKAYFEEEEHLKSTEISKKIIESWYFLKQADLEYYWQNKGRVPLETVDI
jgi:hypothetical protein